jgi:hypothetical protein
MAKRRKRRFIQKAIKRPGALTRDVGGPPGKNIAKVRRLAKSGTTAQKRRASFYLNVLRPAARRRRRR